MTPEDVVAIKDRANLMLAWCNGAKLEVRPNTNRYNAKDWEPFNGQSLDFEDDEYRLAPVAGAPDTLYICVSHPEPRTTSYAVMPHRAAALGYICDEVLVVQVTERLKGKESV